MQRFEERGALVAQPFYWLKFVYFCFFIFLMLISLATQAQSTCYETITLPSDSKFGGGDVPGSKLIGNTYGAGEGPGIYIVADGGYRLYLNDELLAYDNAAGRVRFIPMTFLPGKNAISIVGVNGQGAPGVLMHLEELEKPYVTDAGWKVLNNPADNSWKSRSYNDSAWPAATVTTNGTLTTLPSGGSLSAPAFPIKSKAKWIWSGNAKDKNVVLRYTFNIKAIGFGAATTGGDNSNIVIVKSEADFLKYIKDPASMVLLIPEGTLDFRKKRIETNMQVCESSCEKMGTYCGTTPALPGLTYKRSMMSESDCSKANGKYVYPYWWEQLIWVGSNKSIIGMGRGASLRGASFYSNQTVLVQNLIFRNLKIWDVNPHIIEAQGGITLDYVTKLWVDHCSFKWISDGNDVSHAKEVTYSWNHWNGYNEFQCNGRDFYAALVSDSDVTFDHVFWNGGSGRNPKANINARVHVINNYHKDNVYYAIASNSPTAEVLVDANYFDNVCFPTYKFAATGRIYCNKNIYVKAGGFLVHNDLEKTEPKDAVFTPPYKYSLDLADSVPSLVAARAGAGGSWGTMPLYTDAAGWKNTAPDVSISSPSSTEVSVSATDGNGIGKVEFYSGITKIGEVLKAPYNLNVGADTCTRSIVAIVYDTKGLATTSLPITLCKSLVAHKYQVNKGSWLTGTSATVHEGDTIKFSPQPSTISSGWSWQGPGNYTASTRAIQLFNVSSAQAGVYIATLSDGSGCSANANFTLTVTSTKKYTLTTTATPTAGGTITGAGNYKDGTVVTVNATPATGYIFTGWSGDATGKSTSVSVTMDGNKSVTATFKAVYTLSTSASPAAGGTVSGAGSYNSGDVVTVKATPAAGYIFTGWSGDATGTSTSIGITMDGNKSVTATFKAVYTLSTSASPAAGGTVSGAGSYNSGDVVTVKATPATGYIFTGWSGDATGTSTSIAITMDGNKSVTATFKAVYTLSTSASPAAGGTVSGAGSYNSGDVVTVKATPAAGYIFTGWSGDASGTSTSIAITMDGNKSVTANFQVKAPDKYTLATTTLPAAGGTVIGAGSYNSGDVVTVKATPATGYIFTGWSGDVTGTSSSVSITMDGNKSVTANFQLIKYTLAAVATPTAGGTASGAGSYNSGDVVTVKATPAAGYVFIGWSGDATGTSTSIAITMDGNKSVTANFQVKAPDKYTLATTTLPAAGGTVIGAGSYNSGDVVTVKATPATGYIFTGWSGDVTGTSSSVSITMDGNKSVTANFQLIKYTLAAVATPTAGGTVSGAGSYNSGDVVTVKATPATGYIFTGWSGDVTGTSTSIAITMDGNKSVTANFRVKAPDKYTLTTAALPSAGGAVSGAGSYNSGDVVMVKATPATGYIFTGWSGDATGTSTSVTITMDGSKSVTANFQLKAPDKYTLTTAASPAAGGTVSGAGSYNSGDVVMVKATPATGYIFTGWSGDATGTSTSVTITMDGSKSVTANFQLKAPDKYTLTTAASPSAGGTVSGAGSYNSGDVVMVKATPATGYIFTGWSGDATGTSTSVSIMMDDGKSVIANFQLKAPDKYTLTATASPVEGGAVNGAENYDAGATVTITVTPATGYIFTGWSGDIVDTSPEVTLVMSSDKTVTANFEVQTKESVTVKPRKLFSPDNRGDASTETWEIENAYLLDGAEIVIYNRQGQKVYASIGYNTPWDGTSGGRPLPDGAYFYTIVYPDHRKQTGSVTIARLK